MDNQVIIHQVIDEEDPIPNEPPPPYESPKKIVWDIREVEAKQIGSTCKVTYPGCRPIKITLGTEDVDDDLPSKKDPMLPQDSDSDSSADSEVDHWALTTEELGTKWSDLTVCGKFQRVTFDWFTKPLLIITLLYLFICSLDLMSSAFRLLGGKEAGEVFSDNDLLRNPVCGLMIGILATVLVQSSSTSTSITVSIVAAGILPVEPAIFIIMGANIGTSVTNTIVSMAQSGNRNEFRRAFGGATIHDMFNWLSVIILLPIEVATSYLYRLTKLIVDSFNIQTNGEVNVELLKKITKPFSKKIVQIDSKMIRKIATGEVSSDEAHLLKIWCKKEDIAVNVTASPFLVENATTNGSVAEVIPVTEWKTVGVEKCHYLLADTGLSERVVGAILLIGSLVALCICLICMVKLLNSLLKGRMATIIKKTLNADFPGPFKHLTGYFTICVGAGITFLVQSSSVFTSALTPLVGVGVITLERMFPLTLGSNIGTTATGILAAMASDGSNLDSSIQIALCHLFFNISGILIWYPVPFMRNVPINLAKMLGNTTAKYRWFAGFYLLMMFFALPCTIFGLSMISIWALAAVGLPVVALAIFVVVVNVLQSKKQHLLPKKLQTWEFLPLCMHSLAPMDRVIVKTGEILMRCCPCSKDQSGSPSTLNDSASSSRYLMVPSASNTPESQTPRTVSTNASLSPSLSTSLSTSLESIKVITARHTTL